MRRVAMTAWCLSNGLRRRTQRRYASSCLERSEWLFFLECVGVDYLRQLRQESGGFV